MLSPVRIAGPTAPVATVAELAQLAVVGFSDDNLLLASLLQAATDHLDGYSGILGRCMVNQTWRVDLGCWPAGRIVRLPFPDVSSIEAVAYSDADDAEQTLDAGTYRIGQDVRGSFVRFGDAFAAPTLYSDRHDPVRVSFVAGYGAAASDVPMALRVAVMMLAAHWYENREGQGEMPPGVEALIEPYRRVGV